ncbi:methyltransferase [Nocardia takedensis]
MRLTVGYMTSYAVRAAARTKLVDAFDGPRPVVEAAAAAGLPAGSTRRLLRALTALGVFSEPVPDTFEPTATGELLRSGSVGSMGAFVEMFTDPVMARASEELESGVRTEATTFEAVFGKPFFEHLAEHSQMSRLFNASMSQATHVVAQALAQRYDFGRPDLVVDVGGGDATLLSAILAAHSDVRGIVYDSAEGIADAHARLNEAGVGERSSTQVGDFFASVPAGADVYLLKSIIHDWDDDRAAVILGHCRAALPEHGRLLIIEPILPDRAEPGVAAGLYLSDLNMLVNVGGRERTGEDFERLCRRTGFAVARTEPLLPDGTFWLIEAVPA